MLFPCRRRVWIEPGAIQKGSYTVCCSVLPLQSLNCTGSDRNRLFYVCCSLSPLQSVNWTGCGAECGRAATPFPRPRRMYSTSWQSQVTPQLHSIWAKPFPNKNTLYSNLDFPYALLVPAKHPSLESGQRVQIWKLEILLLILFFRRCLDLQFLVRSLLIS